MMIMMILPENDHHPRRSPGSNCDDGDARDDPLYPLIEKNGDKTTRQPRWMARYLTAELWVQAWRGTPSSVTGVTSITTVTQQPGQCDAHLRAASRHRHITTITTSPAQCRRAFRCPSRAARGTSWGTRFLRRLQLVPALLLPINCAGCAAMFCSTVDNPSTEGMGWAITSI
jgi:hypothetical protein